MRRLTLVLITLVAVVFAVPVAAQNISYTGSVVHFPSGRNTRVSSNTFTLDLTGVTSDADAGRLLATLAEGGQDALLKELQAFDLGNFSIGGRIGPRIRVVRISEVDGKRRIFAAFDRWITFEEFRFGSRSTDYRFGVIEIFVDPRTGRGEGTYIAAAKVQWKRAKGDTGDYEVEIENFGTFPSKLMGVTERGSKR